MIKLKKLLLENVDRKYILPPNGEIFQVKDHLSWAAQGPLKLRYGHLSDDDLDYLIVKIYDDLKKLGYLTLVWTPWTEELYVRIQHIFQITPSQIKKIEDLAYKIAEEYHNDLDSIKLIDDNNRLKVLWKKSSMY